MYYSFNIIFAFLLRFKETLAFLRGASLLGKDAKEIIFVGLSMIMIGTIDQYNKSDTGMFDL